MPCMEASTGGFVTVLDWKERWDNVAMDPSEDSDDTDPLLLPDESSLRWALGVYPTMKWLRDDDPYEETDPMLPAHEPPPSLRWSSLRWDLGLFG
mmetsp:Transcript_26235/g.38403  ORF Transcript_26235/g.38403 Transcript_26235/m.38403 type:complete len:95 (+) Transcript_26235:2568-2852(+)